MKINKFTDKQRLDWLSKDEKHCVQNYEDGLWGIYEYQGNVNDRELVWLVDENYDTLREAIDAAMTLEKIKESKKSNIIYDI